MAVPGIPVNVLEPRCSFVGLVCGFPLSAVETYNGRVLLSTRVGYYCRNP